MGLAQQSPGYGVKERDELSLGVLDTLSWEGIPSPVGSVYGFFISALQENWAPEGAEIQNLSSFMSWPLERHVAYGAPASIHLSVHLFINAHGELLCARPVMRTGGGGAEFQAQGSGPLSPWIQAIGMWALGVPGKAPLLWWPL